MSPPAVGNVKDKPQLKITMNNGAHGMEAMHIKHSDRTTNASSATLNLRKQPSCHRCSNKFSKNECLERSNKGDGFVWTSSRGSLGLLPYAGQAPPDSWDLTNQKLINLMQDTLNP